MSSAVNIRSKIKRIIRDAVAIISAKEREIVILSVPLFKKFLEWQRLLQPRTFIRNNKAKSPLVLSNIKV